MDEQQVITLTARIDGRRTVDRVVLGLPGGHEVAVEVVGVNKARAVLAIDAPRMVGVERGELAGRGSDR